MPSPALWLQIVNVGELLGASLDQGDAPTPVFHCNLEPVLLPKGKGYEEVLILGAACSDSLLPCMGSWETKESISMAPLFGEVAEGTGPWAEARS